MFLLLTVALLLASTLPAKACKGCVNLDEHNFDKIISRFKAVLVKFDVAYPYGEKHETFTKLADGVSHSQELLVAEVGVKDYGERDNEKLAKRFGVNGKDDLPSVKLFVDGKTDSPVDLKKDAEFTLGNLQSLIRDNTDIYIGLPGCLESYDKAAMDFVGAADKEAHLKEMEEIHDNVQDELVKKTAAVYVKFMKKIIENGFGFVQQEKDRLKKILKEGKINKDKKEELSNRLNILHSFHMKKDEL